MTHLSDESTTRYWQYAIGLALFTIFYNLAEGVISVYFGVQDDALSLLGFGIDSFIELISGAGILAMVIRIRQNPNEPRSRFEKTALQITGAAFYMLAVGLVATAVYNLFTGSKPSATLPGVVISLISIAVMAALVWGKRHVGRALHSSPMLSDANCTMVCIYMSVVLLLSSLVYHVTGFGFADVLGAFGLVYFSVREGKEAFEKAAGMDMCGCGDDECAR